MLLNYGWDPFWTAIIIGAMTSILSTAFFELWRRHGVTETANLLVVVALVWLGWGFTSYPLQWRLITTMTLVAYAVNQIGDHLFQAVLRHRHRRKPTPPEPTTALVHWNLKDWKDQN